MSFLSLYLEHTKDYESPGAFWKWSAFATIAAVLRDNCYRRQGDSALFPNIYVLILADSGIHRKGRPVEFSEQLLNKVRNTKVISGRTSIQAILDELAHTETDKQTGAVLKGGSAIFYAPELSAGIVGDPQAVSILTDIYDYKPNAFTSRLRTQGKFRIDKMIFSMLAASNEELLKSVYDVSAMRGGLLARTFVILADEFRPSNSLLRYVDNSLSMSLVFGELLKISKLAGEFVFNDEAIQEYEAWYKPFRDSYKSKPDRSGIVSRIHTGAVKLSMLLAANDVQLEVCKCHMEQAILECQKILPNYQNLTMATGKSDLASAGTTVLNHLLNAPNNISSRKDILREHWTNIHPDILDKVIQAFTDAGYIQQVMGKGMDISYFLTDYGKKELGG